MKNKYGWVVRFSKFSLGLFLFASGLILFFGPVQVFASDIEVFPVVTGTGASTQFDWSAISGLTTGTLVCSSYSDGLYGGVSDPGDIGDYLFEGSYPDTSHPYENNGGFAGYCYGTWYWGSTFSNVITIADDYPSSGIVLPDGNYWESFGGSTNYYTNFTMTSGVASFPDAPVPVPYYAQIKNSGGSLNLRDATSTSADILKTLPEDWIVQVASTTDASGNPIMTGAIQWYQVTDPTDGVTGWMAAASSTTQYLSYDSANQANLEATSTDDIATSSVPDLALNIISDYYSTSTGPSLYDQDSEIAHLNDGAGYPQQIIPGIIEIEDGSFFGSKAFSNDNVSSDYGHGLMQLTFEPGDFDNRGVGSDVTIPPCSASGGLYANCYTAPDSGNYDLRYYQPDTDSYNFTYRQYASSTQSIYGNIKDGLHVLGNIYDGYESISVGTTTDGTSFSADDIKDILTTEHYNGGTPEACQYVATTSIALSNIQTYFPDATTSDIADLIPKMYVAEDDSICGKLHSPANISIQDSSGKTIGLVNGEGRDDFPLAVYDKDTKFAEILAAPDDNYSFRVEGTGTGTYELDITMNHRGEAPIQFKATSIPITPGEVHTYTINKQAFLAGQNDAVTVKIDTNGDGIVDKTITSGPTLTGTAFTASEQAQNQSK